MESLKTTLTLIFGSLIVLLATPVLSETSCERYSPQDIQRMRAAILWSWPDNAPWYGNQRDVWVETQLLTYMQNCTSADELIGYLNDEREKERVARLKAEEYQRNMKP